MVWYACGSIKNIGIQLNRFFVLVNISRVWYLEDGVFHEYMLPGNLVESQSFDRPTSGILLRCISRSYSSVGRNSSPRFPKCKRLPTGVEVANRYLRQRNGIYDTSMYIDMYVSMYIGKFSYNYCFGNTYLVYPIYEPQGTSQRTRWAPQQRIEYSIVPSPLFLIRQR